MSYIKVCKESQMVLQWNNSDLTLWVDLNGCTREHDLKLKFWVQNYLVTIGAILASSRGHMLMSSSCAKNRVLNGT